MVLINSANQQRQSFSFTQAPGKKVNLRFFTGSAGSTIGVLPYIAVFFLGVSSRITSSMVGNLRRRHDDFWSLRKNSVSPLVPVDMARMLHRTWYEKKEKSSSRDFITFYKHR
jgi:hypothetical protein